MHTSTSLQAVVYSTSRCLWCTQAVELLHRKGYCVEIKKVDTVLGLRTEMLNFFPEAKTVPQCIVNGVTVGGFEKLTKYLK